MTTATYDTAAALAITAEHLADALDDNRPGWPALAETARALASALTPPPEGTSAEPDVDAIAARAAAAPAGQWLSFADSLWIPWHALDDAEPVRGWDHGRFLAVTDNRWHGSEEPPAALWTFLAAARDDVLTLAAEVRRLRAALAAMSAAATVGQWACHQCGAAWFGTPPEDGLCPGCGTGSLHVTPGAKPAGDPQ
jgi:hypothetical protein